MHWPESASPRTALSTMSSDEPREVDPSEFVQRIRRLGDQRDHEDAERVKKLEEELLQGRSERLARRAGLFFCFFLLCSAPRRAPVLTALSKQNEPAQFLPTSHTLRNRHAPPPAPPRPSRTRLPRRPRPP